MRKILVALVLASASLGLIGLTPSKAEARWWNRGYVTSYYYPGYSYYYPSYSDGTYYPSYSYGYYYPGYTTYYTPGYTSYYYGAMPYTYGSFYTPTYSYGYAWPGTTYYYWR